MDFKVALRWWHDAMRTGLLLLSATAVSPTWTSPTPSTAAMTRVKRATAQDDRLKETTWVSDPRSRAVAVAAGADRAPW